MEIKIDKVKLVSGITGIIDNKDKFISLFKEGSFIKGNIYIDGKKMTKQEKQDLYRDIVIIDDIPNIFDYNMTVYEYLKKVVLDNELNIRNYHKKISDSMKIISFSEEYLDKSIFELSRYEKKMIVLAGNLLKNPKILIFNNFFRGIDFKNTKVLMRLIGQMADKYNKQIIICSNDVNFLYNNTENMVAFKDNELVIQGKTRDIFEKDSKKLVENEIAIPYSVQFVTKSNNKGIKLNFNKDIRDLIKDIYKKV